MTLTIKIKMDNAAFFTDVRNEPAHGFEVARILRDLADMLTDHGNLASANHPFVLFDSNGNRVGVAKVTR